MRSFALAMLGCLSLAIPALAGETITGRLSNQWPIVHFDQATSLRLDRHEKTNEPRVIFDCESGPTDPGLLPRKGQEVVFQWLPDQKVLWIACSTEIRKFDISVKGRTSIIRYETTDFEPDSSVPDWFAREVKEMK